VVGAEYSVAAVAAALETSLDALEETFEGLAWRGHFVRAAGIEEWPDGTIAGRYRFVHALYQNVLYERIAPARRVRLHRRVGMAKEAAYGARTVEIAGALAAHFEAARDPRRAVEYRLAAGEVAIERHADHEAIGHLERGLTLLAALPEERGDRGLRELTFLVRLVTPLMSVRGYAAPEVGRALLRARELGRELPAETYLPIILRGLVSFFQVRTEYAAAVEAGEEMLALCEHTDDVAAHVQAHYGHGVTLFDLGRIEEAKPHLARALALYDPSTHAGHLSAYGGYDPGVACRAWNAWIDLVSGRPDSALATGLEAVALAETLNHPFSLVWAEQTVAIIHLYRSDLPQARAHLAIASACSDEHGFAFQMAVNSALQGWALLSEGKAGEAEGLIRSGMAGCKATGAEHSMPGHMTTLAAAVGFLGRYDEGLDLIDQGIALCAQTGAIMHLVDLHRIRGTLLALSGADTTAVEAELREAVEIARRHGMRWLELRASLDLARLWKRQDRAAEARALLAPLCEVLVEGGDLSELEHARAIVG
jgi:tetratricopeptide (TPR) repeat protein